MIGNIISIMGIYRWTMDVDVAEMTERDIGSGPIV